MIIYYVKNNDMSDKFVDYCISNSVKFLDLTKLNNIEIEKLLRVLKDKKDIIDKMTILILDNTLRGLSDKVGIIKSALKYDDIQVKRWFINDTIYDKQDSHKRSLELDTFDMIEWQKELLDAYKSTDISVESEGRHRRIMYKEIQTIYQDKSVTTEDKDEILSNQSIEENKNDKRFWLAKHNYTVNDYGLGEIWNEAFSMYLKLANNTKLEYFLNEVLFNKVITQNQVVKICKLISDHAKRFGSIFDVRWDLYVNLDSLWKFGSFYNDEDEILDIIKWFNPPEVREFKSDTYYKLFYKNMDQYFIKYLHFKEKDYYSFQDWLKLGRWGTSGATDMSTFDFMVKGDSKKSQKTKNASLLSEPIEALSKILDVEHPQVNIISVKPDEAPNKTRLVAGSDNYNYLLMSYISEVVFDNFLPDVSTLYKEKGQMSKFWLEMIDSVNRPTWKLPLDQKNFDHHITRRMLDIFFRVLKRHTRDIYDFSKAVSMLKRNILHNKARWIYKGKKVKCSGKIEAGMPSGWRWTADLDTLLSYVEEKTNIDILKQMGYDVSIWQECFQGDDIETEIIARKQAIYLIAIYSLVGFEINKGKFFLDQTRNEFLRRVQERGVGMYGYAARTVHALLWKAPGKLIREKASPTEILDSWLLLKRRLRSGTEGILFAMFTKDICGSLKISRNNIRKWLRTPVSLGGAGYDMFDFSSDWISIKNIKIKNEYKVKGELIGLSDIAKSINLTLTTSEIDKVANSLVTVKQQDEIKTRLEILEVNRKDNIPVIPSDGLLYDNIPKWKSKVPNLVRQILISRCKNRDDFKLLAHNLKETSQITLLRLCSNASLVVIKEWLQEGYDIKIPRLKNISGDFLSGYFKLYSVWIKRALGMRKLTQALIRKVMLGIEIKLANNYKLKSDIVSLGMNYTAITITG